MNRSQKILFIVVSVIVVVFATVAILSSTHTTVRVSRTLSASPETVWKHWTEPESIKKWWSPKNFHALTIKNNVTPGGKFLFGMQSDDGRVYWNAGTYITVVPYVRLLMDFYFSDETGNRVLPSVYSIVGNWSEVLKLEVEFHAGQDATTVTVTETGVPTVLYPFAKVAWEQQLDKFELLMKD